MVSAAVAGDDLQSVAGSASDALGCPIAIALPALGAPVVWPTDASPPEAVRELVQHAAAVIRGEAAERPRAVADSVPIRIGHEVVGIVAALGENRLGADNRAWLEAAATAAAVTSLMRESQDGDLEGSRRALLRALAAGPPADMVTVAGRARRLGVDLGSGVTAICAQRLPGREDELPVHPSAVVAEVGGGRVLGLLPLSSTTGDGVEAFADELRARGMEVAVSAPRQDPAAVHDALREAELLVELAARPDAWLSGQEETYRLLIGVLLRDPEELELLRSRTIAPLGVYDARHDTELLATLQAFLAHHGSTTETAEAMRLHRHTVGYRLSRVHEVSGLSPYESDGRERLSLGLKADQILDASRRLCDRTERE
jgi:PucR C-terminal helix-turn-helix domain/GGDEF-like domain